MPGADSTLIDALNAQVGAADPALAGDFVIIAEIERWDIINDVEDILYVSTSEFSSDPSDSPASIPYWARLGVSNVSQSILSSGDFKHHPELAVSGVSLLNIDGALDDEIDPATYSFRGRKISLLGGLRSWTRSQFKDIPGGHLSIVDFLPKTDTVEIATAPLHYRSDLPVQQNYYGGFGAAYDFSATSGINCGDVCNLGLRDCTIQIRFKTVGVGGLAATMIQKRNGSAAVAGNPGFSFFFSATSRIVIYFDDTATFTQYNVGGIGQYDDDIWHTLTVLVDRTTDNVKAYVDKTLHVNASVTIGSMTNIRSLTHGVTSASTRPWQGELDEPRIWYRLLSEDEIFANYNFTTDGAERGLIAAWKYDEYTGTVINNSVLGPGAVQADLDGTQHCDFGNNCDPGSGSFAVTGWFRTKAGISGTMLARKGSSAAGQVGYIVAAVTTNVLFYVSDGSTQYNTSISGITYRDDTLYGFALVVDRTANEFRTFVLDYPRGVLIQGTTKDITGAGTFGGGTDSFRVGNNSDGTAFFTGAVSWVFYVPALLATNADVQIALSEQVVEIYADSATVPPSAEDWADTAGAHFWPIDENTGTTANDQIGAVNGTFNSTPTWVDRHGVLTTGVGSGFVTTLEGAPELKGTPKPLAAGRVSRVLPVMVDETFQIYQFSDPAYGPTTEVEAVYEGAALLTLTTDYTVDLTDNIIDLVAVPDEAITVDVKGVQESGRWLHFPGEIMSFIWRILLGAPVGKVDAVSTDNYDDSHPYEAGIYLGSEERSLESVHTEILSPDGFVYRSIDDKLTLASRVDPSTLTPVLTLEASSIESMDAVPLPLPAWAVKIGFNRTINPTDAFSADSTAEDQRLFQQEYRYVEERNDSIKASHKDAIFRTYLTFYHRRWDAGLLVQKMLSIDGYEQRAWLVKLTADHLSAGMGDGVTINSFSRHNVDGKTFQVIGHEYGVENGMPISVLTLWG